ncbi:hypothetical protein [Paenibacillus sp. XY044]|uniref:hypothetical protein n=1 Tax=Paenibacillus sp. XY044 TaxID=2026089 RepID=UPI000B9953E0|nr:hypothetical protein [Paenibacillus sp. XY044]OZB98090.1 hypothetical protein CJP46_02680 [Paenibacillus sp. XY044]
MNKSVFKVNRSSLPEELAKLDWQRVGLHPSNEIPEVACVFVITKTEEGVLVPLQAAQTGNLKRYIDADILKVRAHNNGLDIQYILEEDENKRRELKNIIDSFFGLDLVY